MDFQRCVAFDVLYYGNNPFKKTDTGMDDIYAVLAIPCPPQTFFGPLREVGEQFISQVVGKENGALLDVEVIDDTVDFLGSAMADMLAERIIDLCASLEAVGGEYDDEAIYEVFHAMIGSYDPDENQFLGCSELGDYALVPDAAARTLDRKEAIYYELSDNAEADAEYATISGALDDLYDNDDAGDNYDNDEAASENIYDRAKGAGVAEQLNYDNDDAAFEASKLNYDNDDAAFEANKLNYDNDDAASSGVEVTYALASDLGIGQKNKFNKKNEKAKTIIDVRCGSNQPKCRICVRHCRQRASRTTL